MLPSAAGLVSGEVLSTGPVVTVMARSCHGVIPSLPVTPARPGPAPVASSGPPPLRCGSLRGRSAFGCVQTAPMAPPSGAGGLAPTQTEGTPGGVGGRGGVMGTGGGPSMAPGRLQAHQTARV